MAKAPWNWTHSASVALLTLAIGLTGCADDLFGGGGSSNRAPATAAGTSTPAATSSAPGASANAPTGTATPGNPGTGTPGTNQPGTAHPGASVGIFTYDLLTGKLATGTLAAVNTAGALEFTMDVGSGQPTVDVSVASTTMAIKLDPQQGLFRHLTLAQAAAELNAGADFVEVEGTSSGATFAADRALRIFPNGLGGPHAPATGSLTQVALAAGPVALATPAVLTSQGTLEFDLVVGANATERVIVPAGTDLMGIDMQNGVFGPASPHQAQGFLNSGHAFVEAEGDGPAASPFVANRHLRMIKIAGPSTPGHPGPNPGPHPGPNPGPNPGPAPSPSPNPGPNAPNPHAPTSIALVGQVSGPISFGVASELLFELDLTGGNGQAVVTVRVPPSTTIWHHSSTGRTALTPIQAMTVLAQNPAAVDVEGQLDPLTHALIATVGVEIFDNLAAAPNDQDIVGKLTGGAHLDPSTGRMKFQLDLTGGTSPKLITVVADSHTRIDVVEPHGTSSQINTTQAATALNNHPHVVVQVRGTIDPTNNNLKADFGIRIFK